ncbi:type IV pilus biogenesis/stability protein PilW [Oxalicibacterium faecigallinarum]|uniref:Type IV pilus biogenesis/stability protein PilW n=1 Tax=Oxalicibacterium faecigallinarum TaxID=573741 RepID=A0A8J3F0B6_9BURK|nr:type IV pilus biogenesis/stability protein PilW [Oxalicibacterium faecigallinarum]GGI16162.1 type IV pilus biogenesis/stability protein PilW [Oxalicibacterium faecigallinarum]
MRSGRLFLLMIGALTAVLLSACAGVSPSSSNSEFATRVDRVDTQRRASIRLQLAAEYYQQRQLQIALDEVKQALQISPNFVDAHSMAALIYMDLGEIKLAEEHFSRAIRLSPQDPDLSNNYGWFLCQNGRVEQSLPYFESAARNRAYQSPARALTNAGVCSLKLKNLVAAENYLKEAFQLDPSNPTTSIGLARLNYERGDDRSARFYINRVTSSDAISAEALWLAIKIERRLGDRAAEVSLVTQLGRRYPNSAEFIAYQRGAFNE